MLARLYRKYVLRFKRVLPQNGESVAVLREGEWGRVVERRGYHYLHQPKKMKETLFELKSPRRHLLV